VIVNPDSSTSTVAAFSRRLAEQHVLDAKHAERKHLPAITRDGFRVEVTANFGTPGEVEPAFEAGADGIGLIRAEYLFMGRAKPPSEDEQYEAYRSVFARMAPRRVIIRTADIGSDKPAAGGESPLEPNPALGLRGIRLALARPALLRVQLRAQVSAPRKTKA